MSDIHIIMSYHVWDYVSPLANTHLLFSLIIMIALHLAYDLCALILLWLHFSCPFFRFFPTVYVGLIACRGLMWWCQLDSSTLHGMHFTSTILITSKVSRYFPWIFRDILKVLYSRFFLLVSLSSVSSLNIVPCPRDSRMFIPPGIPAIPRNSIIFRSSLLEPLFRLQRNALSELRQAIVATHTLYH